MFKFREKDSRNGVAVIIVLGMMALLMMLGVAFSVSMRIERRSAGNYSHSVATKNLVWAGLARAIDDIESEMNGHVFPPFDRLISEDTGAGGPTYVNLGRGEALDYIPGALNSLAEGAESEWVNFSVEWGAGRTRATNVPGRFSYLILNCSDFIDANYAGGATNRMGGADASELRLVNGANGVLLPNKLEDLLDARDADIRYETTQELTGLVSSFSGDTFSNNDFVVYSRYPVDESLVSLAGSVGDLNSRSADIKAAIGRSVSDGNSEFIFNSLIDYVDADSIPGGGDPSSPAILDSPYVERVPMINEFRVTSLSAERDVAGIDLSNWRFNVELAFPFVEQSTEDFDLELDIRTSVVESDGTPLSTFTPVSSECSGTIEGENPYRTVVFRRDDVPDFPTYINETNVSKVLDLVLEMKARVIITSDGDNLVDAVPFPENRDGIKFTIPIPTNTYARRDIVSSQPSWECIDPRFNWDVRSGRGWVSTNITSIGQINGATISFFADNLRTDGFDTSVPIQMRISNTGLVSVCELGNLLRNNRQRNHSFKTIRVYNMGTAQKDLILSNFTVETNSARRGVVNLNSTDEVLLTAGLLEVPLRYPESVERLPSGIVDSIVTSIIGHRPYTNLAAVCDFDWSTIVGLGTGIYTELERESIVSHAYRLFGVRQNLFAIIVSASPVTTSMGEYARKTRQITALGSKRAIAYVWRDPFADSNGKHKCFVQFFKWL